MKVGDSPPRQPAATPVWEAKALGCLRGSQWQLDLRRRPMVQTTAWASGAAIVQGPHVRGGGAPTQCRRVGTLLTAPRCRNEARRRCARTRTTAAQTTQPPRRRSLRGPPPRRRRARPPGDVPECVIPNVSRSRMCANPECEPECASDPNRERSSRIPRMCANPECVPHVRRKIPNVNPNVRAIRIANVAHGSPECVPIPNVSRMCGEGFEG
eukprot:gene17639-biopygen3402